MFPNCALTLNPKAMKPLWSNDQRPAHTDWFTSQN